MVKQLPSAPDSEAQILGYMLNGYKIESVAEINKEWFYLDKHKYLFSTMINLFNNSISIDVISVAQALGAEVLQKVGGLTYLQQLDNSFLTKANLKYHIKKVKDTYDRRTLIRAYITATESLYDDTKVVSGTISNVDEITSKVVLGDPDVKTSYSSKDLMDITIKDIEEQRESGGKLRGIATGFPDLDEAINGLQKKDLVIIAARPSMGKTVLSLNIAEIISKDNVVAFFSLEMGAQKIGSRLLAASSMIPSSKINKGRVSDEELKTLKKAASELAGNKIELIDQSGINMTTIRAKCNLVKSKHGKLDVVIIDHLGLVEGAGKYKDRHLEIGEITRQGKKIAKDLNCVVIFLSQLSRAVEQRADKRPMLSDLRESGNIEQDADTVLFLYRDEYYRKETEDKNILEIGIGKNRDGRTGIIKLFCDLSIQMIGNLDTASNRFMEDDKYEQGSFIRKNGKRS